MTALNNHKTHPGAMTSSLDTQIPPHVDDLILENVNDTLIVDNFYC